MRISDVFKQYLEHLFAGKRAEARRTVLAAQDRGVAATKLLTTVVWPADEPATVVKFDICRKKASVYTGTVLDGNALYVDFANCICRNKTVVQIDNPDQCYMLPSSPKEGAFRNWWGSWGCHQVVFYGNLRKQIKDFAAATGFEVVEGKD